MKSILVVGASGGIGLKTVEILLEAGYKVYGTYYKDDSKLDKFANSSYFVKKQLDISNIAAIRDLYADIKTSEECLFAIVNCSGIVKFEGNNLDSDLKTWEETIATNLSGNYYLGKVFFDLICSEGRFIMVSSTDSYYGGEVTASYAVSKAGVNSLTKSFALSFKDKKIRVNSIAPGWVVTPMTAGEQEVLTKAAGINPLGRNALPEDIANTIKYLLSDDANYINGQVITVDGGYTNQDPTLVLETLDNG